MLLLECPKRRQTLFQPSHAIDFGLKDIEREPITKQVVSCHSNLFIYLFTMEGKRKLAQKVEKPPTYNIFKTHSDWTITRATWNYSIWFNGRSILSCPMKNEVLLPEFHSTPRKNSSMFSRKTGSTP